MPSQQSAYLLYKHRPQSASLHPVLLSHLLRRNFSCSLQKCWYRVFCTHIKIVFWNGWESGKLLLDPDRSNDPSRYMAILNLLAPQAERRFDNILHYIEWAHIAQSIKKNIGVKNINWQVFVIFVVKNRERTKNQGINWYIGPDTHGGEGGGGGGPTA